MINSLTKEQEIKIKEYREKWLAVGRDITPIDKPRLFKSLDELYREIGLKQPLKFVFSSPFSCLIAYFYLNELLPKITKKYKKDFSQIESRIGSRIRSQIRSQIGSQIESQNNVWWYGQHNASWVGYYEFYRDVFGFKPQNLLLQEILIDLTKNTHWFLPYENLVIISEKPIELNLNKQGQLHKDGSMSVKYADDWGIYALNGIQVPQLIAETPAEKLDPKIILEEKNADIQREIIKKIGAERVLQKLNAKCLDEYDRTIEGKKCHYKLLQLKVGSIDRKYLYYDHFNISGAESLRGVFYAKPVPPECRKALHGIAWKDHLVERGELNEIDVIKEKEIENNLARLAS